jgi:hypothetical protein
MSTGRIGLICVADVRLRGVCSILLRHAGYRVLETDKVEDAKAVITSRPVAMLVIGALADPEDQLTPFAKARATPSVRLAPNIAIESLLQMFETIGLKRLD